MTHRSAPSSLALLALATVTCLPGVARAEGDVPPEVQVQLDHARAMASTLTRAEVLAEMLLAMTSGTMNTAGEIAEPPVVLAARERFNVAQARDIAERYARIEAEQDAVARAAALQLPVGTQVASSSLKAVLEVITERADGTPIDEVPASPAAPSEPTAPERDPAPAPSSAVLHERRE